MSRHEEGERTATAATARKMATPFILSTVQGEESCWGLP